MEISVGTTCKYYTDSTVTGNGIVSCEIDVPAGEASKIPSDFLAKAPANELGVLTHLVSEAVVVEPFDPDAIAWGVTSTV